MQSAVVQEYILKSGVIGFSTKRRVRCLSLKSLTLVIEVYNLKIIYSFAIKYSAFSSHTGRVIAF
jgi:hypothetical protein